MIKIITILYYILIGYYKLLKYKLNFSSKEEKELYKNRFKICESCPQLKDDFCKMCGCYMKAKTRVKKANCPNKLW